MSHLSRHAPSSVFARRAMIVLILGVVCVVALQIATQCNLITNLTEGLWRLIICSGLLGILLFTSCQAFISRAIRTVIIVGAAAVFIELTFGVTEDVQFLASVPIIGRDSQVRRGLERAVCGVWICAAFVVVHLLFKSLEAARDELAIREQSLRLITDNIPAGVTYIDKDLRYRFVNRKRAEFQGLSQDSAIGRHVAEVIDQATLQACQPHYDTVLSGHSVDFELTVAHQTLGARTIAASYVPDVNERGEFKGFYALTTDVTERKRVEDQLRQHHEKLFHVARLSTMGEMATGLAHELNQPLAAMANYCYVGQMALNDPSLADPELLRELFEHLSEQAKRAGDIIRRLRALVRKTQPVRSSVCVNDLIQGVLRLMALELRQSEVRLEQMLDDPAPIVTVDKVQIQQVLVNLIRNALDAMSEAEPARRTIRISTSRSPEDLVEVVVRDTGNGILPDTADQVFDAFFTTKSEGMGMGLAISQTIIQEHGGRIWMTLNSDRGVAFHFTVPITKEGSDDDCT